MSDDFNKDTSLEDEIAKSLQKMAEEETTVAKAFVGTENGVVEKKQNVNDIDYGKTQVVPTIPKELLKDDEYEENPLLEDDDYSETEEDKIPEADGNISAKKKNDKKKKIIIVSVAATVAVIAIITIIISAVVTFIATLVIGFDDPVEESNDINHNLMNNVKSPISGKILDLNSVNDEMFSKEVLGKGVALIPNDNKVYSPVEGIISATFETKHAIGITTDKNMEILIHIGIDTVKFGGKPFKQFVEKGQRVKQGDLLIEFDKELLKQGDADLTTMVVITNSNDYLEIIPTKEKRVKMNDDLLTVI